MTLLSFLDIASVTVFALTGALVASRAQLDIVGFLFLGCLTAVGGGTLRDLLLGRDAVFWITDPSFLFYASAAAVIVFFTAHLLESRVRALIWLDAAALAIAVPAGVGVATGMEQPVVIVVLMGVVTGCFGGLMRDVVANEVPLLLRQGELYASAALAGAASGVGVMCITDNVLWPVLAAALVTFALRAGSLMFGWRLPVYRARPPRN